MSRSNPTVESPVKYNYKWRGSTGELIRWDKEEQKEISAKFPFEFLVLDELATIAGFSEGDSSTYFSNEVRNITKEPFTVRTSSGIKQEGFYKDLGEVRSKGAKYAKSIYALAGGDIINIRAHGAALTAWIGLSDNNNVMAGKVVLTGSEEAKKGATTYFIPQFKFEECSAEEGEAAVAVDKELQVFLKEKTAPRATPEVTEEIRKVANVFDSQVDVENIPF